MADAGAFSIPSLEAAATGVVLVDGAGSFSVPALTTKARVFHMAESSLSISAGDLRNEILRTWNYGRDYAGAPADIQSEVDSVIDRGLRTFYYPEPLPGEMHSHEWSFLTPVATIDVGPDVSTTLDSAPVKDNGTSTVTVNDAVLYNGLVGKNLVVGSNTYVINSVTSTTIMVVTGDASGEIDAAAATVTPDGIYDLPDDFGGMRSRITFDPDDTNSSAYDHIPITRESIIRSRKQSSNTVSTWPRAAAVRPKKYPTQTTATEGQRFELMLWPIPDAIYTLTYRYNVLPDTLDATDNKYPYGGMHHSETIIAACMMIAELRASDSRSQRIHQEEFIRRLRASVWFDRRSTTPENLGYNSDFSDGRPMGRIRGDVTYNDVLY